MLPTFTREKLKKTLKGSSFQNVLKIASGSAAAQAIALAVAPILTRLYTPEMFGVFGIFMSTLGLFRVISNLRYELAIPIPRGSERAKHLLYICLFFAICLSLMTFLLVMFFHKNILLFADKVEIKPLIWLLPVAVLMNGLYQPFYFWAVRSKAFGLIARSRIVGSLANATVGIVLYPLHSVGLIAGQLAIQFTGLIILASKFRKSLISTTIQPRRVGCTLKKYRDFALYSTPTGLITAFGMHLPNIILGFAFGEFSLGNLTLAQRLIIAPTVLIGNSIGQVFFSQAPERHRENKLVSLVKKTSKALLFIACGLSLLILLCSPLLPIVFGTKWTLAASILPLLIPQFICEFTVAPLSGGFIAANRPRDALLPQFLLMAARLLVLLISSFFFSFPTTVLAYSLASGFGYLVFFRFMIRCLSKESKCVPTPYTN